MSTPNPSEHNQWYPFLGRPLPGNVDGVVANPPVVPVSQADSVPNNARFVVIGAGIHGLSTAYHLAMELEKSGKGKGSDVLLIDRQGPGAGATGLACGCVRNLYMTGPLHAILRASVEVWESDPVNFGFQQVGYVSVGEANQEEDYVKLQASQEASGYASDLYTGAEAHSFLTILWPDFKTDNCDVVLHEHRSGYAGTHMAVWGLDEKCAQWGVQRAYGVTVTGYDLDGSGSVNAVETNLGSIQCEQVVVGAGAWTPAHWEWLGGPSNLDVLCPDGHVETNMDMSTYWRLLEGEVYLPDGVDFRTAQFNDSPVLHVELMNTPVYGDDGNMLQDHFYSYTRYAAERVGAPGFLRAASYLGDNTVATLRQLADHVGQICEVEIVFDDAAPRSSGDALKDQDVDLVWACGLLTVELQDAGELDAEIVAAPVFAGQNGAVYHSVLVCRRESEFASVDDAIGARLAINEAESWSGHHGLVTHLASRARSIEMFGTVVTTGSHASSVAAVTSGAADLAAIDHTVWDQFAGSSGASELVAFGRTADWPAPPFSLSRSLDPNLRVGLAAALISIGPNDIKGLIRIVSTTRSTYEFMRPPPSP